MHIKQLQLFIHLCDSKSFTQTAAALHVSPSALSRQIQKLEQDIKHPLFIRDNRSVTLTRYGKKLLPVAMRILEEWQELKHSFSNDEKILNGELRVFCSVTASYSHLPALIRQFRLDYPLIELKIITGDPAQAIDIVVNDIADIAIAAKPYALPSKIAFQTICDVSLSVIAPAGVSRFVEQLRNTQPSWQDLPFILPETGTARERANHWFKEMKIKPNVYAQVAGHEALVSMVALGCGIGIAPDVVIDNSPVRDKIERLTLAPITPFELGVCCLKGSLENPLVNAFWQVAKETYIFN